MPQRLVAASHYRFVEQIGIEYVPSIRERIASITAAVGRVGEQETGAVDIVLLRRIVDRMGPGVCGKHLKAEVRIEVRRIGRDEVSIAVTDTGAGIADEAIGRLFDPFFTTKASGTGLGLAITRRVVAALGGEVALRRRPEGGTEALIRIHAPAIGKTVAV